MSALIASEPADVAHTYRYTAARRLIATFMGVVLFAAGPYGAWAAWNTHSDEATLFWRVIAVFGCLASSGFFGFYFIVASARDHLVLTADRVIVYQMIPGRQSLRRDEIKGRRVVYRKYDYYTLLVPNRPGLVAVKIDQGFETDPVYDAWLASIPVLDATNP